MNFSLKCYIYDILFCNGCHLISNTYPLNVNFFVTYIYIWRGCFIRALFRWLWMSTVDWMTSPKIAVFSRSLGKEFCPPNSYCQIRQRRTMTNKLQPQRLYLHCEQFAWIHVWNALRWKLNLTIGIIIKFDFCCRFGRDWIPNMNLNSKMSAEIIKFKVVRANEPVLPSTFHDKIESRWTGIFGCQPMEGYVWKFLLVNMGVNRHCFDIVDIYDDRSWVRITATLLLVPQNVRKFNRYLFQSTSTLCTN